MVPRETENNAYAKFWGDKQRALWYVMLFSVVVNCQVSFSLTETICPKTWAKPLSRNAKSPLPAP